MSSFLDSIYTLEKGFREGLPNILKEAAKKYQGTRIFFRQPEKFDACYTLEEGYVLFELRFAGTADDSEPYNKREFTYEQFVRILSLEDLVTLAEKLKELGF